MGQLEDDLHYRVVTERTFTSKLIYPPVQIVNSTPARRLSYLNVRNLFSSPTPLSESLSGSLSRLFPQIAPAGLKSIAQLNLRDVKL